MGRLFDSQAATYDQRAGLPGQAGREVARAVLELAKVQPGDVVVEVGAGTGQIGQWLAREAVRYVGFDLSPGMLRLFRRRLARWGVARTLLVADGKQGWPFREASVRVIFSSRALHLLPLSHVVAEISRVVWSEGAMLIVGRVQWSSHSLQTQMKQQLHHLLRQHGLPAREGEQHQQRLLACCCQHGAKAIAPLVVARWRMASTPREALANWRNKPGLGGLGPPARLKQAILTDLATWAEATFGDLERQVESEAVYVLQGARFRPVA
jgi:ubiquinone/menaquinone biosynthesis C-methylase UbiE